MLQSLFSAFSKSGAVARQLKIVVAAVALGASFSAQADYPIIAHSYSADPAAVEFNGRLYLYGSNDNENGTNGYAMASINCFSTDDLKNWTDHGVVFRANTTSWASLTWAPSAISNNNRIYLYFANGAANIGVATSSVPTGPFVDARGSSLINGSTPGASTPTQWLFDPGAFVDDNGQAYVYFGGQYPTNARVIRLAANLTSVSGSASEMFATNFFEAAHMHKRNGIYYYTYCNRFEVGAAIYCETNSNPTNGFVPQGTVLANPPQNVNNNNHHAIVSYLGNWYIAYHNRAAALANGLSNGDAVYKRSLCLDAINYNANGSIQQVTATTDGLTQLKNLDPYTRVEGETVHRQSGIKTEVGSEGGLNVTSITNGSWIRIRGVNFSSGASTFYARVASAGGGGNIELRLDSLAGTLVGTGAVSPTGGWQNWTTVSCNVSNTAGVHDLYLKFTGGAGNLFNLNWWQFVLGAVQLKNATINPGTPYQTIEGFGGAIAFYNGWVTAHPYKNEIYTNAFAGLNLSMLRLANWYRYQTAANFDPEAAEFVSRANQILGRPVPVYMSSWAPPAFLKSNGEVGNGGTLIYTNGGFAYTNFANYWYDSLRAYRSNGVSPTWISIQNEPDWEASYDSCIFRPTESYVNATNYWAGYPNALAATYQRLTNLPSPPKLLGPEVVHIRYNTLQNYAATMNPNHFYGVNYHLYGDSTDGTIDGYLSSLRSSTNFFPTKPHFMTEYGVSNMIDSATLIHHALTEGRVSGYNFWSLIWPSGGLGLVQIEFPWNQAQWTNAPPGTPTQSKGYWLSPAYWSMKHYSYYVQPGFRRVAAGCNDTNALVTAYLSPDNLRLVLVFINRSSNAPVTLAINTGSFLGDFSAVYQTAGANKFQPLGSLGSQLTLPAASLTTVVLDRFLSVGQATNPSPTNNATSVALDATLSWTPGSNALTHAVYLGINSDVVAQATTASPEFKGFPTNNTFTPTALSGNTTWFWRVDEIAGINTNAGPVWSFRTAPGPVLAHRYSFSETIGTTIADSAGGPVWNGTLPGGGTFSGGTLRLLSSSSQYASLPAGIVASLTDFTIESWVNLTTTNNWARLFDFGNNTTVNMFLTPRNGSDGRLRFAITTGGAGAEQRITGPSGLSPNVWYHVAVTLASTKGVLYVNGASVATNHSMTLNPAALGSTANNYIGKSQWPDPYLNGWIDEFRIYSVALSPAELAATYALGPNQLLSTNSPPLSLAATPTTLTLTWPLASAGYMVQSRTNLVLGNWVNVASPAPQIIGGQWRVVLPVSAGTPATFYRLAK
jgi:arabinoxylan arabinofuranohydrolase